MQAVAPQTSTEKLNFTTYLSEYEKLGNLEEKLRFSLEFLKSLLAEPGCPGFSDFWKVRRMALPLFKENLKNRAELWQEFSAISGEARGLKEVLDAEAAFAVEQIELAILSIERDLENLDAVLGTIREEVQFGRCHTLKGQEEFYILSQKEISLMGALATKLQGLRQELIKTGMRIRTKNGFFARLSTCGDRIFPRRKALVQLLSESFVKEVAAFVEIHFKQPSRLPFYVLRDEIKELQAIAKDLSLSPQAFTEIRTLLSTCWDQLKEVEKEKKAQWAEQKEEEKKIREIEQEKMQKIREVEAAKREKIEVLKGKLTSLVAQVEDLEEEQTLAEKDKIAAELAVFDLSRIERQQIEQLIKQIKVALTEKRERAWMLLPEEKRNDLETLQRALEEGKVRRLEIREELEGYRKALGGSGFDFEKGMMYRELIETAKDSLEKVTAAIEEIEAKIEVL